MAAHVPSEKAPAVAPADSNFEESWRFPARSRSAGEARRQVGWFFTPTLPKVRRDDLCLVVGEVMANAIQHSANDSQVELRVAGHEGFVRVEVINSGPGLAARPGATAPSHDGGFGLYLVEQLTREWGIAHRNERTQVWFEFDYE